MFRKIASFELRYQLGLPVFWVTSVLYFLLSFAAVTNSHVHIGAPGNTNYNAPIAIIQTLLVMSVLATFAVAAFVANVVVRDDDTGYGQIIRTTSIRKRDYLFGRFTGAFAAAMILLASVPLAMLVGTLMPWVDPTKLGPFRPLDYLYAYFVVALPTLLVLSAVLFALATATRSMMATYVGAVAFLVLLVVAQGFLGKPEYERIAALLNPLGGSALHSVTKYWTASDRNTMLPPLSGVLLTNRLIWLGVSALMLALAYLGFRFEARGAKRAHAEKSDEAPAPRSAGRLPAPRFDSYTTRVQSWTWTRFEMAQVFKSPAFFVLMLVGLVNAVGGMWHADRVADFVVYPVTRIMIQMLAGAFSMVPIVIATYYAGELVWRERDRGTHELVGACPVPDWAFVLPKVVAVALVLVATILFSVVAAVVVQTIKGYHDYQIGHYLLWYVLPLSVAFIEVAALSVFLQVLSPNKYLGWLAMAVYMVVLLYLPSLGYENILYIFGGSNEAPLSDMNGVGRFWIASTWSHVYWGSFSLVLVILAYLLWRRGTETRLWPRLARLPHRLAGGAGRALAVALLVFAASGGYIYYNTHILNEYRTSVGDEERAAAYEKALLQYEKVPQPRVTDVKLNVAIYPYQTRVLTDGGYVIQNRTAEPISRMHVRWADDLEMVALEIEGAEKVEDYGRFNYRIYAFDRPMAPGEKRIMAFETRLEERGFRNSDDTTRIVRNGTFVTNIEITPIIGMDRSAGLLSDPAKRRRYGLPSQLRPPKLEDDSARANNYLSHDVDWVTSDITVSTVADQTPVAPGYAVADTVEGGRRTVRFESKSPILPFFSVQSADYAVERAKWKDVELAVYYDRQHPYDVDRMISAMKASLEVYARVFSPFQFRQARILEFPAYSSYAQSFANTIPYSESIGFIQDSAAIARDPERIDMVTYVTAHEMAHQWWAHQLIGADMQGDTLLSETLAQYSAMLVMEKLYGPEHVRKFLKYSLDRYLRARAGEEVEELPLERVENQGYIHYDKGAVVMYRLKEAVGEQTVNRALRRMLSKYAFQPAPYPSSKDFIAVLREEVGPRDQQLVTDLFQHITIYDLRASKATWTKRGDGKYDMTLEVEAHKRYADGKGKEAEVPMHEEVEVGAFLVEPGTKGFDESKILAYERLPVQSGKQTLHLVTAEAPAFAGIAPYNEWIDRDSNDNITSVSAADH